MDAEFLSAKARSGDDNAFFELIHARKEILYRTAYTYVRNRDDALDIVNEAVYKAYRSIGKLKEPALFNTWLMRILIICSLDHKKKFGRLVPVEELPTNASDTVTQDNIENLDLYSALGVLDENCRTVIILKYFQDLTITQISEIMQCPRAQSKLTCIGP